MWFVKQKTFLENEGKPKITKDDFLFAAFYYERGANGHTYLRQKARDKSRNTAYIFVLIAKFE